MSAQKVNFCTQVQILYTTLGLNHSLQHLRYWWASCWKSCQKFDTFGPSNFFRDGPQISDL